MPSLSIRKPSDVPQRTNMSRAVRERHELYESFIRGAAGNVGELVLAPGEQVRAEKVRLRRASTRLGIEIQIWDADTGKNTFKTQGHGAPITTVAISPDGKTLATGSYDRTIRLWNIKPSDKR